MRFVAVARENSARHQRIVAEGVERLWEISEPLLNDPPPVRPYAGGTWGPNAVHQLIAPRAWRLPFERTWRRPNTMAE